METASLILSTLLGLIFVCLSIGFYTLIKNLKRIHNQQLQLNQTLEDIARSQRILANNPKDFEETKRISQLKCDMR